MKRKHQSGNWKRIREQKHDEMRLEWESKSVRRS